MSRVKASSVAAAARGSLLGALGGKRSSRRTARPVDQLRDVPKNKASAYSNKDLLREFAGGPVALRSGVAGIVAAYLLDLEGRFMHNVRVVLSCRDEPYECQQGSLAMTDLTYIVTTARRGRHLTEDKARPRPRQIFPDKYF